MEVVPVNMGIVLWEIDLLKREVVACWRKDTDEERSGSLLVLHVSNAIVEMSRRT